MLTPALLVQAYATSLASGIDRLYWYWLNEDNGPALAGSLGMLEYNGTPKPVIPAYAVCVKYLAGKKLAKTIPIQDSTCFIFTGEGKPVAVIWTNPGKPSLKIELPANAVQVIDCMGNRVQANTEMISAKTSVFPLYIQGLGSLEELTEALSKQKLE